MAHGDRRSALALLAILAIAGCKQSEPTADMNAAANADATLGAPSNAVNTARNAAALPGAMTGALIPPAPGEPGGLPDDRAPLDEKAARDPTSVPASGGTIERWGIALSQGRYGDAYRLWQDSGAKSGLSEDAFADAYRKYAQIHVLVGRPVADGPDRVQVPVQMYGRLKATGKPFNLRGMMMLARNPAGQHGEAGQPPWLIAESALKPLGTVRVEPGQGEAAPAALIPAAFQGRWASSAASCARIGDDSRLTINAGALVYYESLGQVRTVDRVAPGEIRVSASYSGEGKTWSRDTRLKLSDDGKALTIDGLKRRRCAS